MHIFLPYYAFIATAHAYLLLQHYEVLTQVRALALSVLVSTTRVIGSDARPGDPGDLIRCQKSTVVPNPCTVYSSTIDTRHNTL